MDLFPNGSHVRLRSRARDMYLYADEDWVGVSLSHRRASLNAAWRVHRLWHQGTEYVILSGAAYGRYLAISPAPAPPGHRGFRAVQQDYGELGDPAIRWRPISVGDGTNDVFLRVFVNHNLRANGRYLLWHTGVTADNNHDNQSTMTYWVVEAMPLRADAPALPPPPIPQNQGGRTGLFRRRAEPRVEPVRLIRYFEANAEGHFNPLDWAAIQFTGTSVYLLKVRLAYLLNRPVLTVTMCVWAGAFGSRTPLVVDLPYSMELMDIVVITTGSPADLQLRHPDVDAP